MAKKDRPVKLPRKVGDVKIPKAVRQSAIADFLGTRVGQALVAEAVLAAATLAVVKKGSAARRARKTKGGVQEAPTFADVPPSTLAYAFSEAGRAFTEALKAKPSAVAAAAKDSPDADWPADFAGTQKPARKRAKPAAAEATTGPLPH